MRGIGRPTCRLDFRVVPTRRKRMRDRPVPVPLLERPNQSSVRLIMSARADRYRQRAADAKDRAGQAKNLSIKSAFEHVAAGWAALAELKRSGSTGRSFHYATKKPLGTYRRPKLRTARQWASLLRLQRQTWI
jgi:hypothetical protein